MSPIGSENFYRLEEFPSFISCIKCFGRPIIPPLLTPNRRNELKQLRIAAINKEAENLRIRNELLKRQKQDVESKTSEDVFRSDFQSFAQESCALWYPSGKDYQEGASVAISKFPTSGIYSSVHNGAIVCSNVIESSHAYTTTNMENSLLDTGVIDCQECSHNNINLECSLCQAEYIQNFHNKSFTSETSPEVPCRTFSLPPHYVETANEELNYAVEETECDSLPTVICNQKYVPLDTDSESNTTYMTQSTDLEKYMEFSCEFNSPDNSVSVWDSKSVTQQYTLSRSDDASSETIVNTENELTPCASTMAELTDTIEDELSNIDEPAAVSEKELVSGTLKRSHSVDSYMKTPQTCSKTMNVKKSFSEPFNTDLKTASSVEETRAPINLKTNLLIKEDSKESDESKEIPEKDSSVQEKNKEMLKSEEDTEKKSDNSFQKRHIRQNSYTLDEPSTALILAHADCTCNFDANCLSPHCSALKDENEFIPNSAFMKEKVEVDIPVSHQQIKKLPIFNSVNSSGNVILDKENMMSTVIDVFPVVQEDKSEKNDSGNAQVSKTVHVSESEPAVEVNSDTRIDDKEHNVASEISNCHERDKEYVQRIYQELKESQEKRMKELLDEQNKQWFRLKEEFIEQERLLCEKFNLTIHDSPSKVEQKNERNCCSDEKTTEDFSSHGELFMSNSSPFTSDQNPTSDNSSVQNSVLPASRESYESSNSPSKNLLIPNNARASISPSRESSIFNTSPSKLLDNNEIKQLAKDSDSSVLCNFNNKDQGSFNGSESFHSVNGFSCTTVSPSLPQCSHPPNAVDVADSKKRDTCFCDISVKYCKCCSSFNGYCDVDVNNSYSEYTPTSEEQNSFSNSKILSNNSDSLHLHTSSPSVEVQGKNVDPETFINSCNDNSCNKILSSSSKISNGYISTTKNVMSSVFNDQKSSTAVNSTGRNILPQLLNENSKLPIDSIVSLRTKSLKSGSVSQADAVNKRIIDPDLLKRFEKLPAFVKGYFVRRLIKSERVQGLIKHLQDTAVLIEDLDKDLTMKNSISEKDVELRRQLISQLMTTFKDIHNILCNISTKEKMAIIAESRKLRLKQKELKEKEVSGLSDTANVPEPVSSKKHKLSSATLKALERKKRSTTIDNRTYTVEDFKNARSRSTIEMKTYTIDGFENFNGRSHSSLSAKNRSVSPSTIYKPSIGMCIKRKTASAKSSGPRRCLHNKWVP